MGGHPAWLAEVRGGNFAAIPLPFSWDHSIEFAHLIDGYALADTIDIGQLSPFANARLDQARAEGFWSGTAIELWCCLFFEHRRYRHMGEGEPTGPDLALLNDLCATLRLQLQTVTNADRRTLTAAIHQA